MESRPKRAGIEQKTPGKANMPQIVNRGFQRLPSQLLIVILSFLIQCPVFEHLLPTRRRESRRHFSVFGSICSAFHTVAWQLPQRYFAAVRFNGRFLADRLSSLLALLARIKEKAWHAGAKCT